MPAFEELNPAASRPAVHSYIDWPAVLAGAVVAMGIATIFTTFGAALGLSALKIEPNGSSIDFALIISAIWIALSMVASYMAGGYIAGRMRARAEATRTDEVTVRDGINGLVVWGLGVILGAMVLGNALSSTVTAVGSVADSAASAAGPALGAAAGALAGNGAEVRGANAVDAIASSLLRPARIDPAAGVDPASVRSATSAVLSGVMANGEISDVDRQFLVTATQAAAGLPPADAAARVDQTVQATMDARAAAAKLAQDAEDTAKRMADATRIGAVLTGFLLAAAGLVAAAAAYVGAVHGGRHRDEGRIFGGFSYRT